MILQRDPTTERTKLDEGLRLAALVVGITAFETVYWLVVTPMVASITPWVLISGHIWKWVENGY